MSVRKQILDPLSTLCKLALLTFYENGSKISINDNTIEIQRSESKQWIIRTYRGDNKEHISLLYNPIVKAIQWYIFQNQKKTNLEEKNTDTNNSVPEQKNLDPEKKTLNLEQTLNAFSDEEKQDAIKNIASLAIDGLRELKTTYKDGNVVLALQFLINNLKIAISDNPDIQLFEDYNDTINFEDNGILNYDKIKEIWNTDTIKGVNTQFLLCNKYKDKTSELENMLESLNLILRNTDAKFKKLVIDMNSTL